MISLSEKYSNGDKLTDKEILEGCEAFKRAADALVSLGPHFTIAFRAANMLYLNFHDIAIARGLT